MEKHTENQATEVKETWLREALSAESEVESPPPKGAMSWVDRFLFVAALESAERTVPVQAIRLALAAGLRMEHLVCLLWSEVNNFDQWVVSFPRYPKSKENGELRQVWFNNPSRHSLGKSILVELLEARKGDEDRVLPDSTQKGLLAEIRAALRKLCKEVGLPYIELHSLVRGGAIRLEMETGDSRPAVPREMKFRELPWSLGKRVLRSALSEMPSRDRPMDSADYMRGRDAAVQWLSDASLAEIREVAWDCTFTGQGIQAEDEEDSEITELYGSSAACVVKELLGLDEWPLGTEGNVNFVAGFHQLVDDVDGMLWSVIRVK